MTGATIVHRDQRPAVQLERRIAEAIEVVWRKLTDIDQLRRWFPCEVMVDGVTWKVGAGLTFPFPPAVIDMTLTGIVLACDPPNRLAYTWGDNVLTFELAGADGGTKLVLTNELEPDGAARNAAGWDECLDRLMGLPVPDDAWQRRFENYSSMFAPLLGPQSGPPPNYKGK